MNQYLFTFDGHDSICGGRFEFNDKKLIYYSNSNAIYAYEFRFRNGMFCCKKYDSFFHTGFIGFINGKFIIGRKNCIYYSTASWASEYELIKPKSIDSKFITIKNMLIEVIPDGEKSFYYVHTFNRDMTLKNSINLYGRKGARCHDSNCIYFILDLYEISNEVSVDTFATIIVVLPDNTLKILNIPYDTYIKEIDTTAYCHTYFHQLYVFNNIVYMRYAKWYSGEKMVEYQHFIYNSDNDIVATDDLPNLQHENKILHSFKNMLVYYNDKDTYTIELTKHNAPIIGYETDAITTTNWKTIYSRFTPVITDDMVIIIRDNCATVSMPVDKNIRDILS